MARQSCEKAMASLDYLETFEGSRKREYDSFYVVSRRSDTKAFRDSPLKRMM